jgi:hypothetical protein
MSLDRLALVPAKSHNLTMQLKSGILRISGFKILPLQKEGIGRCVFSIIGTQREKG